MKTGKVVLGLLAGVAAGAILGILFAPDKGSNTRKKIVDKGEGYAEI
jgi:gas vesicle protein